MAGKRHHILPRFLLKGFASRVIDDEKVFTWLHRIGGMPFETNVNNVNVENHFYGKASELSVDDEITSLENGYAILLNELRNLPDKSELIDPKVPDLIAHLCTRTRHLRDSIRESSDFLIEQIFSYLADFNNIKNWILNHPGLVQKEIGKIFDDNNLPPIYKDILVALIPDMTGELLESQRLLVEAFVKNMSEELKKTLPTAIKEGHIKALSKELLPEFRVETYRKLKWTVNVSDIPLILGDTGCLFETKGNKRFKSINDKDDIIENIYLPISANRMLTGSLITLNGSVDYALLNEAMAKCSREFFICSERSIETQSLLTQLGIEADIISKKEIETMLGELFIAGQ